MADIGTNAPSIRTPGPTGPVAVLVAKVLTSTPRAGMWKRFRLDRVPELPETDEVDCPECGRWIPPVGDGDHAGAREQVDLCLVHGWRSRRAIAMDRPDLEAAAEMIGQGLADRGWTKWAHRFAAAQTVDPTEDRASAIGRTLEHFRRFGPCPVVDQLETLVVSSAPLWGQQPEPDGNGLFAEPLIWIG